MVSIDDITVQFGSFELLTKVSFSISGKDRIGLTGRNGAGKTTLLRLISGNIDPTSGRVTIPDGIRVGYLPQKVEYSDTTTVIDEALKAFEYITTLQREVKRLANDIEHRTDWESESYLQACNLLTERQEEVSLLGGDTYIAETEKVLTGLGFDRNELDKQTSEVSGGWRIRIELAKLILSKPSLLLLDEPTNHLDIESIQWFEDYLSAYKGAVVLVSHDRTFLDNICNRTIELSLGKVYDYRVPYSRFLELRKERIEQQMAAWRNQQKMISDTERFIERFRYKNTKAVQVQSRIKMLEKLERIEIDEQDSSSVRISFPPAPRSGRIVVETEGLSKSYGEKIVLQNINFQVERGEKVAFVGKNGEGKTTLARIIADNLPHTGRLKKGHNLKMGYYAQNQDRHLDEKITVFQTIDNVAIGDARTRIREMLGAFLFSGEDINKKVSVLSGGERSRLALVKLLLEPCNLLVMDEPTNHLDITSKEILKQALVNYDGTLIVVSHDRNFLDGLADKIYEFRDHGIKEFTGNIYEFVEKRLKISSAKEENKQGSGERKSRTDNSSNKQNYIEKKNREKKIRKLKKELSVKELEIHDKEEEKRKMEAILSGNDTEMETPGDIFFKRYRELTASIDHLMNSWTDISAMIEELEKETGNE